MTTVKIFSKSELADTLPKPMLVSEVIVKYNAVMYADFRQGGVSAEFLFITHVRLVTRSKTVSQPYSTYNFGTTF
jgi:hypothetical protein